MLVGVLLSPNEGRILRKELFMLDMSELIIPMRCHPGYASNKTNRGQQRVGELLVLPPPGYSLQRISGLHKWPPSMALLNWPHLTSFSFRDGIRRCIQNWLTPE